MTPRNASLPRRLGAMLYDGLLVLAVLFLATLLFLALRGGDPVELFRRTHRGSQVRLRVSPSRGR